MLEDGDSDAHGRFGRDTEPPAPENRLTHAEIEALIAQWDKYAWNIAKKWYSTNSRCASLEAFHLAVIEGFWEGGLRFDKSRNVQFSTYVTFWADKQCRELIIESKGFTRSQFNNPEYRKIETASLDADYAGTGDGGMAGNIPNRPDVYAEETPEFPDDFWERVNKWLSPRYQQVIDLRYRQGMTLEQAGEVLGITRERVRQLEQKILRIIADRVDFGDCLADV